MRLSSTGWRRRLAHTAMAIWLGCLAGGAVEASEIPPDMPKTPFPDFKGCSTSQEAFLKEAWRAGAPLHVASGASCSTTSWPAARRERTEFWSRTTSPIRKTSHLAAGVVRQLQPGASRADSGRRRQGARSLRDARRRGQGYRHRPMRPADCPGERRERRRLSGQQPWNRRAAECLPLSHRHSRDLRELLESREFGSDDEALERAVRTLVHEVFHWLSVDGKYVTDYHGDGVNGQPDQKYYGVRQRDVSRQHKPAWAVYNNDTYGFFARHVGAYEPTFTCALRPEGRLRHRRFLR